MRKPYVYDEKIHGIAYDSFDELYSDLKTNGFAIKKITRNHLQARKEGGSNKVSRTLEEFFTKKTLYVSKNVDRAGWSLYFELPDSGRSQWEDSPTSTRYSD